MMNNEFLNEYFDVKYNYHRQKQWSLEESAVALWMRQWYTFQFETYPLTSKIQRNTAVLKGIKIMFCDGG